MPDRIIQVQPPLGGIDRSLAYQSQPPFTTPHAVNVRPRDCFEQRARIGNRPGWQLAYPGEGDTGVLGLGRGTVSTFHANTPDATHTTVHTDFNFGQTAKLGCLCYFPYSGISYRVTSIKSGTVTTTHATETFNWVGHSLADSDMVQFTTDDTLPSGLVAGTTYYVKIDGDDAFNVYTDAACTQLQLLADDGTGNHTCHVVSQPVLLDATEGSADLEGDYPSTEFIVLAAGTVTSCTYPGGGAGTTTVEMAAAAYEFASTDRYRFLYFDTSGVRYEINSVTDADTVELTGDASAETGTFKVYYTKSTSDWPTRVTFLTKINPVPDFETYARYSSGMVSENWLSYTSGQEPNDVTDGPWDKPTLSFQEDYEFFNDPTDEGTAVFEATPDPSVVGYTVVTLTDVAAVAGWTATQSFLEVVASGNMYEIVAVLSPTSIQVSGDASSETDGGAVKVWQCANGEAPIQCADPERWQFLSKECVRSYSETGGEPLTGYHFFVDASSRDIPSDMNTSEPFYVSIDYALGWVSSVYTFTHVTAYIILGTAAADDQLAVGIGYASGVETVYLYQGGVLLDSASFTGEVYPGWHNLRVSVDGTSVKIYHQNVEVLTYTLAGAETIDSYGFFLVGTSLSNHRAYCQNCTLSYQSSIIVQGAEARTADAVLLKGSYGSIYHEIVRGELTQIQSYERVRLESPIRVAEHSGELFIADYSTVRIQGTDGIVTLTAATGVYTLDSAAVDAHAVFDGDWDDADMGVDPVNDWCELWGSATTNLKDGLYKITSVSDSGITLTGTGLAAEATSVNFRIVRAPKVYNPANRTLHNWCCDNDGSAQKGQVPLGCPLIARAFGRIFMGGAASAPHVWYCCRTGDPYDWDYGSSTAEYGADPNDTGKPISGSANEYAVVADPLTAIIPWGDDYVIFACEESIWCLRGDPGLGASIDNLSRVLGVINKAAWCWGPSGELVFLSRSGLCALAPGASSVPILLSERLPEELKNIDTSAYTCLLMYDVAFQGIHIFVSRSDALYEGKSSHWYYDWQTRGFWKDQIGNWVRPTSICSYPANQYESSQILTGCFDGNVRRQDLEIYEDAFDSISQPSSCILLGPFALGGTAGYFEGLLKEINATFDPRGGDVTWKVYTGDSAQAAYASFSAGTYAATGTFSGGVNYTEHPRVRGVACFIELSSSDRWALENMNIVVGPGGKFRKA